MLNGGQLFFWSGVRAAGAAELQLKLASCSRSQGLDDQKMLPQTTCMLRTSRLPVAPEDANQSQPAYPHCSTARGNKTGSNTDMKLQ